MSTESKFCTGCGCNLEPGMQFCPQCGTVVAGSASEEQYRQQMSELDKVLEQGRINWIVFALAIYAIPVTIAGVISLIDANATANLIWSNADFQRWIAEHSYDLTLDAVRTSILAAAGLSLASGLCALVSMICVLKRRMWKVAVAACLLASVLCFWSIFGLFIGLLVTWLVYSVRDSFPQ